MNIRAIYDRLFSKDLGTWLGHAVLGFLITLVFGWVATFVAFAYREVSDLLEWWFSDDPDKRAFTEKLDQETLAQVAELTRIAEIAVDLEAVSGQFTDIGSPDAGVKALVAEIDAARCRR